MRNLKKAAATVLAAAAVFALAACGNSSGGGKSQNPTLAQPAEGETFNGSGYSVVVPDTWEQTELSGYEFVAYAVNGGGADFAENMNILTEDLSAYGNMSLDTYVEQAKKQFAAQSGFEITDERKVSVDGYDAVMLKETVTQSGTTYKCEQMVTVRGKKAYIITYSGDNEGGFDSMLSEAESIMASFKVN